MPYTTEQKVKDYLGITSLPSPLTSISAWISSIESFINNYCNTEFETEPATTKLYDGTGKRFVLVDNLLTLTKVEILNNDGNVDFTIDATDEYYLYPANKTPKTRIVIESANAPISIFQKGYQNVKVTGTFGHSSSVPKDVELAATKLVAGIMEEKYVKDVGQIKSERLGEYDITVQDIDKMANHLDIYAILDRYRVIQIEGV